MTPDKPPYPGYDTFRTCRGSLVLRHGDENVVVRNVFIGDGESGSGGVRLQGTDQVVANNYLHGLGSFGIAMMDGTPDDLYIQVERAQIQFNTFYQCNNAFTIGLNHPRHPVGAPPKECYIAGNIFKNSIDQIVFLYVQDDQPLNWTWNRNVIHGGFGKKPEDGIQFIDPYLEVNENKVAFPTSKTPTVPVEAGRTVYDESDLLGQERGELCTAGAIQFPLRQESGAMLTEEIVGPWAR